MIDRQSAQLWQSKFSRKCRFFRFFGLVPYDNFYADYKFQIRDFLYSPLHIPFRSQDIWNFLELEVFRFDLQFHHRICSFWAILPNFKCDYLDKQKN